MLARYSKLPLRVAALRRSSREIVDGQRLSRRAMTAYGTPKTRRSSRSVPMSDEVAGELDRLHQAAMRKRDHDLVFADPLTGGPMSKRSILLRFRAALKAAKLDDTHRVHDLRHSFGTAMAGAGVPMRTLQEWMGHRDIATTQRYADYAPSPAHERDLVTAAFSDREPAGVDVRPVSI